MTNHEKPIEQKVSELGTRVGTLTATTDQLQAEIDHHRAWFWLVLDALAFAAGVVLAELLWRRYAA